jgi:hypothetical protein
MTKKILLIEDRPGRQAQFLSKEQICHLNTLDYLDMPLKDKCRERLNFINSNEFKSIDDYNLVIVHKSSLKPSGINNLREVCRRDKVSLILFSGGLTQVLYQTIEFPSLNINSSDLYTNRLIDFLENYSKGKTASLLELVYGERWKLEILLRYRQIKTRYEAETNDEVKFFLDDELSILEQSLKNEVQNLDNEINTIFVAI